MTDIKKKWENIVGGLSPEESRKYKKKLEKINAAAFKKIYGAPSRKFRRGRHVFDPKQPLLYVTRREKATLHHLAEGKTLRAIGEAMGIAYRTVEYFVTRIRKRFGCKKAKELLIHPVIAQYLKKEK